MLWTIPHPHTSDVVAANLVSTTTHQFAAWYALDGELRVGRIERGVQRWGIDHDEHEIAGANRTALGLPVADDDHNYPAIGVQGTTVGNYVLHLWANMHANPMRGLVSTAGSITSWSTMSGLPSVDIRCTYPTPVQLPDGRLWFYMRDGPAGSGSARSDSSYWILDSGTWSARTKIFQGLSVAGGSGASVDDDTNWSAYHTVPYVESTREAHPGRMHIGFIWRLWNDGAGAPPPADADRSNEFPSYIYTDNGTTFKSISGTTMTLPITPLNNLSCQTGLTATSATDYGYLNFGGLCVDDNGYPHIVLSTVPSYHAYWNGTAWVQAEIASPLGGFSHYSRKNCIWWKGQLWFMTSGQPSTARIPRLWAVDGSKTVALGGPCADDGSWEFGYDMAAWRLHGTIEVLTPDGDTPKVVAVGNNARFTGGGVQGGGFTALDPAIDATGVTDVVDDLNTFFAGLPDGAKVRFPAGGFFNMQSGQFNVPDTVAEIDFNFSTLRRTAMLAQSLRHPNVIAFVNCDGISNVVLRNGILEDININNGDLNQYADVMQILSGGRTVTNGVTATNNILTSATANFTNADIYHYVTGAGIPSGTSIISRQSSTQVTLSRNTTATATGVTVAIRNHPHFYNDATTPVLGAISTPNAKTLGEWGIYSVATAFAPGIDIAGCDGVDIIDWEMTGVWSDYVNCQGSDNVNIINVYGRRNGRQAIAINGGNNILISNCDIQSTRSCIDVEPTSGNDASNIEISDSTLGAHLTPFANNGEGSCDNVRFLRNIIPWGGGALLICIPGFSYTDGTTTNGDKTLGSQSLNMEAEWVGQPIRGAGIPNGTTIESMNSESSIELSNPATATATSVDFRVGHGPRTNYEIRDNVATYNLNSQSGVFQIGPMDGCVIDNNEATKTGSGLGAPGVQLIHFPVTDLEVTNNTFTGCGVAVGDQVGGSEFTESGNTL